MTTRPDLPAGHRRRQWLKMVVPMVKDSAAMAADAIDIHTHIVPARFPPHLGDAAAARWPEMTPAHDCRHANVVIAGKVFRTVTDECWDVDRRVEAMAISGITRQVLSPMPELLSYWLAL